MFSDDVRSVLTTALVIFSSIIFIRNWVIYYKNKKKRYEDKKPDE